MRAASGQEQSGGVLTIANPRRGLTDNDTISQSVFSRMARIQCEASGVLTIVSGLTAGAQYANMKSTTVGKLDETGNDVRGGLFEKWIARVGD